MTEPEAVRALRSVRVYCTPTHREAVDYAIRVLWERHRRREQEQ